MKTEKKILSKEVISWAFYDWANSAFATTVMAGFFPLFFKSFWASNLTDAESTGMLGIANSLSGLLIVLIAPFLGAVADITFKKKYLLVFFMIIGTGSTASFFLIQQGDWILAMSAYIFACIGSVSYTHLTLPTSDLV